MRTIDLQTQIKFERILLATDFSDDGEIAQAYAVGLALQDESTLEITTVVTLPSLDAISECALDSVRHSSEEELVRLSKRISGVNVTRKVIEGFQRAGAIVDEAVRSHADLIVLGTRSKHGLKKLALGSTSEEVIRTAHCPVLTVGPRVVAPPHGPISFHRIVYATDFSTQAAKGVDLALALGQTAGTKVYLCHVVADHGAPRDEDCEAKFLSSLKALIPASAHCSCEPEFVVEHGKSSEAILDLAKRINADLIVLGARKASFWLEFIRTGLTPALLASAMCPVLTVC
jgi:nucleotide-binding universal stress UspA family protein